MRLILLTFLILCSAGLLHAQISVGTLPANEKISGSPLFNGEPFLAINPANNQNLVAAWMTYSLVSREITIDMRSSFDGGATWSTPVELPHQEAGWGSADVSMAWQRNGMLFLSYVDYLAQSDTAGGVFVTHSNDGGLTWSPPILAIDARVNSDEPLDRPWIAVDNSTAATNGNLYIPTKPPSWNPLPNHTYFTRSIDGGSTWSIDAILDSVPYSAQMVKAPMGSPAVANDGTLYIAYPCFDVSQGVHAGFALAKSVDGGASFTRSFILQPVGAMDTLFKNAFQLLADPSNANHLLFAWPDSRNGDNDVYTSTSFDGGLTWSMPVRVNDDASGNGVVQDMIWPAFASDGTLAIIWRDRRNGTGDGYASATDTYYAISRDGGRTYEKNLRMTDSTAPYEKILDEAGNDFMSAVLASDTLYAAWGDTRTGILQVYFAKAAIGSTSWVGLTSLSEAPFQLRVSPNPAIDGSTVSFTLPAPTYCTLLLFDMQGKLIRQILAGEQDAGTRQVTFARNGLSSGSYLLLLRTANGTQYTKLAVE
jgi:hypothetical protein